MTTRPPVWSLIRDAIQQFGGRATNVQIRDAILARYPDVSPSTINNQITFVSVNSPSRVYARRSIHRGPRLANDPDYDLLFKHAGGELEWYDPTRHGIWAIVRDQDGRLRVALTDNESDPPPEDEDDQPRTNPSEHSQSEEQFLFRLELQLRDFLAANIGSLSIEGAPLRLFESEAGRSGIEYPTGVGPIDVLAIDAQGALVIFELKLGRGPDATVGQLARYMGWVRAHLANERAVRGVIVAKTVDEKLRYAASIIPNVALFEYAMSFTLKPTDAVTPS